MHPFSSCFRRALSVGAVASLIWFPSAESAGGRNDLANPDFTRGESIPEGATHDWNLGPTGARGWMYSNRMETSGARQVRITEVAEGSPADGILVEGDVLLGVAGVKFSRDPRRELGEAIGDAEAKDGVLSLIRWREGRTGEVTIPLEALGAYGPTAPFDCEKSRKIFEQGCRALAKNLEENPGAGNGITRSYNALALLASGNPEYLSLVRDEVARAASYSDLERKTLHAWFYGPINMLLAEYTLATGDESFLEDLRRISLEIARGQSEVGSWGHRFIQDNGRLSGYGMMNAPGVPLTTSLILAREAGVKEVEVEEAIDKSLQLIRFYVGKGSVPYGDHAPWIQTHEDNGKNGASAVMFHLSGDEEATRYFSRMSVASHGAERDTGHTGNFFNMLWAMPGVALSGPEATGAWMKEFGWYYDLARRWDGTFLHQGPPQARPDSYRNWDTTGVYLLAYAQPLRKTYLTGRKPASSLYLDAEEASRLVEDGKGWSPRIKNEVYDDWSEDELLEALTSWSPVVRERAGLALGRKDEIPVGDLLRLLENGDPYAQLGACQALVAIGARGGAAVPVLRRKLKSESLWLRVKAAEALASIGDAAMPVVPELLAMLSEEPSAADPRGMQQRYLCFALFDRRRGLLARSLKGVDREALLAAVRAGLTNEDGRARGTLAAVYDRLTFEELTPILPAIHEAVVEPAPSGIMFADGIRLSGLELLAKHRVREAIPLCLDVLRVDEWGMKNRIKRCLKALREYGGAAQSELPRLVKLEENLSTRRDAKNLQGEIELVQEVIEGIRKDSDPPELRSL